MNHNNVQNIKIDPSKTTPIICESCGGEIFEMGLYLRRVPKLLAAAPQDLVMNIPVFMCKSCGYINNEFKPVLDK